MAKNSSKINQQLANTYSSFKGRMRIRQQPSRQPVVQLLSCDFIIIAAEVGPHILWIRCRLLPDGDGLLEGACLLGGLHRVLRRQKSHRIIAAWVMLTETRIKLVPSDDIVAVLVVSGQHAVRHGLLLRSIQIREVGWQPKLRRTSLVTSRTLLLTDTRFSISKFERSVLGWMDGCPNILQIATIKYSWE